jgi:hypothetical protein
MTRHSFVDMLPGFLRDDHFDALLGDLEELGVGTWRTVLEVSRYAITSSLAKLDVGSVLTVVTLSVPIGWFLGHTARVVLSQFGLQLWAWTHFGDRFHNGVSAEVDWMSMFSQLFAVCLYSLVTGVTVRTLTSRTAALWATIPTLLIVASAVDWRFYLRPDLLPILALAIVAVPIPWFYSVYGARSRSLAVQASGKLAGLTLIIVAIAESGTLWSSFALRRWSHGALPRSFVSTGDLLSFVLGCWPAIALIMATKRSRCDSGRLATQFELNAAHTPAGRLKVSRKGE